MRTWLALGLLAAAAVGCVLDVGLPDGPTFVLHADCGAKPTALAHIAGLDDSTMVLDLEDLYVIASESGDATKQEIWQVPLRGGPPTRLASDLPPIAGMSLGGGSVVVTTNLAAGDAGATGDVLAVPNGRAGTTVRLATSRPAPGAVIAGDHVVYWAEQGLDHGQPFSAIMTLTLSGDGGVTTLQRMDAGEVPRQFRSLALGDDADGSGSEWLYWTTGDPAHPVSAKGEIHGCALPTPLSPVIRVDDPDGGGAGSIEAIGDNRLVYAGPRGITAVTVEPDGSIATARDSIPTGGFVGRIASNYGPVYFVDPSSGALTMQVTRDASPATARRLATGVDPATALKVDDACVYWIDARAGNVMMVHH